MEWKNLIPTSSSIEFNVDTEDKELKLESLGNPSTSTVPRGRSSHSLSAAKLSNGKKVLILFGGEDLPRHAFENCVWEFNLSETESKWQRLSTSGEAPSSRLGHVAEIIGDTLWVFGGRNNAKEELNDLYSLNLLSGVWKRCEATGQIPQGRSYHASDVLGNNLIVFSGCGTLDTGKSCRLNDIYQLDTTTLYVRFSIQISNR